MTALPKKPDVVANGVKAHTNGTVPVINASAQSYSAKHKLADHFIGGNKLENAAAGPVKDFVAAHDGHTVITSVRIPRGDGGRGREDGTTANWGPTGADCE